MHSTMEPQVDMVEDLLEVSVLGITEEIQEGTTEMVAALEAEAQCPCIPRMEDQQAQGSTAVQTVDPEVQAVVVHPHHQAAVQSVLSIILMLVWVVRIIGISTERRQRT